MLRGRTVALLWLALPLAWIAAGFLMLRFYVHGVWLVGWLMLGAAGTICVTLVTAWWLIARRWGRRERA